MNYAPVCGTLDASRFQTESGHQEVVLGLNIRAREERNDVAVVGSQGMEDSAAKVYPPWPPDARRVPQHR